MINDFSVCLRTSSNAADVNRFRSHTGEVTSLLVQLITYYEDLKIITI